MHAEYAAKYKTKDHGQCEITAIDSGKGRASAYLIGKDSKGETVRIETQSRATALAAIGYVYDGNGGGIPKDQAGAKTAA